MNKHGHIISFSEQVCDVEKDCMHSNFNCMSCTRNKNIVSLYSDNFVPRKEFDFEILKKK